MSERRAAIVRLLESRDDHLPMSVRVEVAASRGFVHRVRVAESCEDCLANGRIMPWCESCGGRGVVERWRSRDPYSENSGLRPAPYGLTGDRHEAARARDAELERLEQQVAPPVSAADQLVRANARADAWERAREWKWARFDYGALDSALDELRRFDEGAYHALHAVFVYRVAGPWNGHHGRCERGLAWLDRVLPDPLRAPE